MSGRKLTVVVCRGPTCGDKRNSQVLLEHVRRRVTEQGLADRVTVDVETCFGQCLRGPNILVCDTDELSGTFKGAPGLGTPTAVLYNRMTTEDVDRVVDKHLRGGIVVRPLLNRPPVRD